jgi:hypothetical protein
VTGQTALQADYITQEGSYDQAHNQLKIKDNVHPVLHVAETKQPADNNSGES